MLYFIADAHLSEQMYAHRPLIKGDSYRALNSVVGRILETSGTGAVFFCGDNFNTDRPSSTDVHVMMGVVSELRKGGFEVYAIQGNHDASKLSWMGSCGVQSIHHRTVEAEGVKVRGIDYIPGSGIYAELEALNDEREGCDILVLHQSFKHLCGFDVNALDVDDVPGCVAKGVVVGHTHVPDIRTNSLGVSVVSPGATHPRTISEPSGTFIKYDGNSFLHLSTPDTREIMRFEVSSAEDINSLVEDLGDLKKYKDKSPDEWPLVEVNYTPNCMAHMEPLKLYSDRCHLFLKTRQEGVFDKDEDISTDIVRSRAEVLATCVPPDSREYQCVMNLIELEEEEVLNKLTSDFQAKLQEIKDAV